ncbi:MAG TPA: hypothetical protein VF711_07305, partial [Acidimicrobiales bacterium]
MTSKLTTRNDKNADPPALHAAEEFMSYPLANLVSVLIGLDLDGVLCDLGPALAARIAERFNVTTHPSAWRTYDLRRLRLGLPETRYQA